MINPKVLPEFSDNKYYMDKTDSVMKQVAFVTDEEFATIVKEMMNTSQDFRRGIEELDTKEEKRDYIKNFLTGIKDDVQSWQQGVQNIPDGPKKMEQLRTIRRNIRNKFPEIVNKIIQEKETVSGTI